MQVEQVVNVVWRSMIDPDELSTITITDFIFHVVHHGAADPILLDEVPLKGFEDFFLARAHETLRGNQFIFNKGSSTKQRLSLLIKQPELFIDISKQLAIDFHTRDDGRIKPGVMMLMRLGSKKRSFFLLIKYDHEQVVRYEIEDKRALLEEIKNGFTKSAEALQKSAFIEIGVDCEVTVIDRTVRNDITEFFRGFLNVQRRYDSIELNSKLSKALASTIKVHKDELPTSIKSRWRETLGTLAKQKSDFKIEPFISKIFGAHTSDALVNTFGRELKKACIDGERFRLDPDVLNDSGPIRLKTLEGVTVYMLPQAKDTVSWKDDGEGHTIITIKTIELLEDL